MPAGESKSEIEEEDDNVHEINDASTVELEIEEADDLGEVELENEFNDVDDTDVDLMERQVHFSRQICELVSV
jgi:hypothetical protein